MTQVHSVQSLRKGFALSQSELAALLGICQTTVSRMELGKTYPSFEGVLRLQVLFGVEPRRLFAGRYDRAEDALMRRAALLDRRLDGRTDKESLRKQALLTQLRKRVGLTKSGA